MTTLPSRADRRRAAGSVASRRPRRKAGVLSVLGELLLTAGVIVLLFLVWQLWWNDAVVRDEQNQLGAGISDEWDAAAPVASGEAVVPAAPAEGEVFAQLRVPRFGADYVAQIAGGVSRAVTLDPIGLGHYPDTQLPGEDGNFAIAGHRNTHGAPLNAIGELRAGDAIVVETQDGWFTYRYRNSEYVQPSVVEVIAPVPHAPEVEADGALLTMTSCNPKMSTAERIIAYAVLEDWTPRADGPPAALDGIEGA